MNSLWTNGVFYGGVKKKGGGSTCITFTSEIHLKTINVQRVGFSKVHLNTCTPPPKPYQCYSFFFTEYKIFYMVLNSSIKLLQSNVINLLTSPDIFLTGGSNIVEVALRKSSEKNG